MAYCPRCRAGGRNLHLTEAFSISGDRVGAVRESSRSHIADGKGDPGWLLSLSVKFPSQAWKHHLPHWIPAWNWAALGGQAGSADGLHHHATPVGL